MKKDMKRIEIINMFRTLGKIKLNKEADREMRNALISDHFEFYKVARENDEYIASLQSQFDPGAVKDVNEAYQRYAVGEVGIDFPRIDRMAFSDMVANADIDITLDDMTILKPLFKED